MAVLKTAIKDDYKKKTHHCKSIITAVDPSSRAAGWGLAKKSPYLENFNQGCIIIQLIAQQIWCIIY
jgi:ionotropic glutamate receptor